MNISKNGYIKICLVIALLFLIFSQAGYAAEIQTGPDGSKIVGGGNEESAVAPVTSVLGTFAAIVVDGDPGDWTGIPDLITDPTGDGTPDLISIKVANDGNFVYILEEFASPPAANTYLSLDTDLDATTGCVANGLGTEYGITFSIPTGGFIGDARDCAYVPGDFPGALVYVVAGNFIEASVPISTLELIYPNLTAFDITAANDFTVVARYNLAFGPICDIQMSQAIYMAGDTVTANVFRFANPGTNPVSVEWKVWLGIPSSPPISIINMGADGSFVLPAGFDQDLGPINLFPAAGMPLGSYELSCRMLDPVTGELLYEDLNPFEIQ